VAAQPNQAKVDDFILFQTGKAKPESIEQKQRVLIHSRKYNQSPQWQLKLRRAMLSQN